MSKYIKQTVSVEKKNKINKLPIITPTSLPIIQKELKQNKIKKLSIDNTKIKVLPITQKEQKQKELKPKKVQIKPIKTVYEKSAKGIRKSNEDSIYIYKSDETKQNKLEIFGIFDGHGGQKISQLLTSSFVPQFTLFSYPLNKDIVTKYCSKFQTMLETEYSKQASTSGSACLIVAKYKKNDDYFLNVVNVGDSRVTVCHGVKPIQLSIDHKPLEPSEKKRIENAGGKITYDDEFRINGLSLSRAFGDLPSKYTYPTPDVISHKLSNDDKFMIIACDGFWDVVNNQTAINLVLHKCFENNQRTLKEFNIAEFLVNYALEHDSTDNVSVIVVFF